MTHDGPASYFPLRGWPANTPIGTGSMPAIEGRIVLFCAEEVRRQRDTPWHVARMVTAWVWAMDWVENGNPLDVDAILLLGRFIDEENEDGFRTGPIWVGGREGPDHTLVSGLIADLCREQDKLSPEDFYLRFERIHPFFDGNGRTGKVLYNWLRDSLDNPVWPPDFFGGIENP